MGLQRFYFLDLALNLLVSRSILSQQAGDIYTLLAGYSDYVSLECLSGA